MGSAGVGRGEASQVRRSLTKRTGKHWPGPTEGPLAHVASQGQQQGGPRGRSRRAMRSNLGMCCYLGQDQGPLGGHCIVSQGVGSRVHCGKGGHGENWLDLGYILKVETAGSPNGLDGV